MRPSPHPDIDPAYLPEDGHATWRELTRRAIEMRDRGNVTRPSDTATASEIAASKPPSSQLSAIRSTSAPRATCSSSRNWPVLSYRRVTNRRETPRPPNPAQPKRLRHIRRVIDGKGGLRVYYVRGRGPGIQLPNGYGPPAFLEAYQAARRIKALQWRRPQLAPSPRRCVADLIDLYLKSAIYVRLAPDTQRVYARVLRRICKIEDIAGCNVAALNRRQIRRHLDRFAPAVAADMLKKLRVLMRCAVAHGWRSDDPTQGIIVPTGRHRRPWAAPEIGAFEAPTSRTHAPARRAYADAPYRPPRRRHLTHDVVEIDRFGQSSDLSCALGRWPRSHPLVQLARTATAFTPQSFGNLMSAAIVGAGLPPTCKVDGLRHTSARL